MALHKNRPTVYREYLGFVRLWRDDLGDIVALIAESSNGLPIEIHLGDEYTVDAIDDIASYPGQRVPEVTVIASGGRVRLVLSSQEASISVTEPNLTERGMVHEVTRIAKERRSVNLPGRRFLHALSNAASRVFPMMERVPAMPSSAAVILTQTRREAPSFWSRKRDDILIAVVSLLAGGVLGYLVNVIT